MIQKKEDKIQLSEVNVLKQYKFFFIINNLIEYLGRAVKATPLSITLKQRFVGSNPTDTPLFTKNYDKLIEIYK